MFCIIFLFEILYIVKGNRKHRMSSEDVHTLLLFFILVTLNTYTFMPWKGIDKGSAAKLAKQWFGWLIVTMIIILTITTINGAISSAFY